jgi:magnesium-transporting ATPase (P-type)
VGVVIYTGMQTKLKMNDEETPPKTTQVEHMMNHMIVLILKVQFFLVLLFGALSFSWQLQNSTDLVYLMTGCATPPIPLPFAHLFHLDWDLPMKPMFPHTNLRRTPGTMGY